MLQCIVAATLVAHTIPLVGCSSPADPDPRAPGKPEYSWTLDTIRYHGATQLFFNNLAGTRDGSVYATASCNSPDFGGKFWRYSDGEWRDIPVDRRAGGPLPDKVVHLSYVAVANGGSRVWMTGERLSWDREKNQSIRHGFLASYDGTKFDEVDVSHTPRTTGIHVIRDDLIYLGVEGPTLYRYDGRDMHPYPLPMPALRELMEEEIRRVSIGSIAGSENRLIVKVFIYYETKVRRVVRLSLTNNETWTMEGLEGLGRYWTSPTGVMYAGEYMGVYRYESGDWVKIHSPMGSVAHVWGHSDRDFWATGPVETVLRCVDGVWEAPVIRLPVHEGYVSWNSGWSTGDEVFISGMPWVESNIVIIAHGK